MTGIQLILIFAIVIVVVGLALLTLGKERGFGTIRIPGIGIEITVTSPLVAIALGAGLFLYATLQSSVWPCIVFCSSKPATGEVTPPSGSEEKWTDQTCAQYAASAVADYMQMIKIPKCYVDTDLRWQGSYLAHLAGCYMMTSLRANSERAARYAHLKQCGAR